MVSQSVRWAIEDAAVVAGVVAIMVGCAIAGATLWLAIASIAAGRI